MLIQVEEGAIINMTGISHVMINKVVKIEKIHKGWFTFDTKEKVSWNLLIKYVDHNGKDANFTLTDIQDVKDAMRRRDSMLSQIKEVELERLSNELENAIRNS